VFVWIDLGKLSKNTLQCRC